MSSLRFRRAVVGCAISFLNALAPDSALSLTIDCAERGASYRFIDSTSGTLEFNVERNDALTWQAVTNGGSVDIDIGNGWQPAIAPGSYRVSNNATSFRIRVNGAGASGRVSCYPSNSPQNAGITTEIAASSQTGATNTGVGQNIRSRFGLASNVVSKNLVFVSTSNMRSNRFLPPNWNAWATLEGRDYSGGIQGSSFDFVAGVDRLVNPNLIVGMLGGFGRTFVSVSGTYETAASPMIGAYFGRRFGENLVLDGFLSFAAPGYTTNGASFTAGRVSAGLNLSGVIERGAFDVEPFLKASTYHESQPGYTAGGGAVIAANEAVSTAASAGVRVRFRGFGSNSGLVPYVSAAADMRHTTTTVGGTDRFIAPRMAFGLHGALGRGQISLDVDIGRTRSDTVDRGVKFGYEMKF